MLLSVSNLLMGLLEVLLSISGLLLGSGQLCLLSSQLALQTACKRSRRNR